MDSEKKEFVAPEYTVVKFDSDIVMTQTGQSCMEAHSWTSGTDCHEQVLTLPQGD